MDQVQKEMDQAQKEVDQAQEEVDQAQGVADQAQEEKDQVQEGVDQVQEVKEVQRAMNLLTKKLLEVGFLLLAMRTLWVCTMIRLQQTCQSF